MIPVRTVDPEGPVVPLDALKAHLRVDHDDEDDRIDRLEQEAVSSLDGYRGTLGRGILRQTWAVSYAAAGAHRLPLPDVVSAEVDEGEITLAADAQGTIATITAPATVTFIVEMPKELLAAVQGAICLMVQMVFDNISGSEAAAFERAISSKISHARWVRI